MSTKVEDRIFDLCPFLQNPVMVQSVMPAGSAAVFDLRVMHRGLVCFSV